MGQIGHGVAVKNGVYICPVKPLLQKGTIMVGGLWAQSAGDEHKPTLGGTPTGRGGMAKYKSSVVLFC